jgi:hypothetical protein
MEIFAYVGSFSTPMGYPAMPGGWQGLLGDSAKFARRTKAMCVSPDANENKTGERMFHDPWDDAGIAQIYYEAPRNSHGWQAWGKSLYGMAPLLFRN